MSHNVPAVYDVFLRPIRKNAKHFYGRKKMWRSKPPQRAFQRFSARPTGGLRSPSRRRRRSIYRPVKCCTAVHFITISYYNYKSLIFSYEITIPSIHISLGIPFEKSITLPYLASTGKYILCPLIFISFLL